MTAELEVGAVIGFIGLGRMGSVMSAHLVRAGFHVQGYDVSAPARAELADAGGIGCDTLAETIEGAAAIILMLPDSGVVDSVVHDPQFVPAPGTFVVDMSSSEPQKTQALAAEFADRGVDFVDAPVSGGVIRARSGTLTIMMGGAAPQVERLIALMTPLGTVTHAGTVGAGHAIKALNNLLSATHLLATAEVMLIGERFGLDPDVMLSVINSSSGVCGSTQNKWPNFVLTEAFNSGFELRLMLKDMRIATNLAAQVAVPDPLSVDAVELWSRAADQLPAGADHTELARWVRTTADAGSAASA